MNHNHGEMTDRTIGERLRLARDNARIRQSDAADLINVSRTTIVAIEKGERHVRTHELIKLARLYGTTVNALMRREATQVSLIPRFRRLAQSDAPAVRDAIELLSALVAAETELENLLGIRRISNYPPERPITAGDVQLQAEQNALEFREKLGIGRAPIHDLTSVLELEIGVRVYFRPLDSRISGLFAYDAVAGACMLLNANHRKSRRDQTASHECGHFVSTRQTPEVTEASEITSSREERYADAFGRALLTPASTVMQKFHELTAGSERLTRRHAIVMSHFFAVSREAMVRRLEELGLVRRGTWDWFQSNGGITDEQEIEVLGDVGRSKVGQEKPDRTTSLRLDLLAAEAYRQQLLSESQLATLLRLDRVQLRTLVDESELSETAGDGPTILAK